MDSTFDTGAGAFITWRHTYMICKTPGVFGSGEIRSRHYDGYRSNQTDTCNSTDKVVIFFQFRSRVDYIGGRFRDITKLLAVWDVDGVI